MVAPSYSAWVTPAASAPATKTSTGFWRPDVAPADPHRASAPSNRSGWRSAAMCAAAPPIDPPTTYVWRGRPWRRVNRSQRAAVSSASRPGIQPVPLRLDEPQA